MRVPSWLRLAVPFLALPVLFGARDVPRDRVEFREPHPQVYYLEAGWRESTGDWLRATFARVDGPVVYLSRHVAWRSGQPIGEEDIPEGMVLHARIREDLVVLDAGTPKGAVESAVRLGARPGTGACHPVMRRSVRHHGSFVPAPDDTYFPESWHLENRNNRGASLGVDLDLRSAWGAARGRGVMVAVADNGIDLDHPDLADGTAGGLHYNFEDDSTDGSYITTDDAHGTAVAGLIGARGDNGTGVIGVAPEATIASWIIFEDGVGEDLLVSDLSLHAMYRHRMEDVSIQNHSWGPHLIAQQGIETLSDAGIEDAVREGRRGRGVVLIRAAGNERRLAHNVNDNGYANDPRSIAVGAVRFDGAPALYSTPGAMVLVAAPSGDGDMPGLVTTDHQGADGYVSSGAGDREDYMQGDILFSGTSASTPLIAGLAALILEIRPELSYRDVQQILIHAAAHPVGTDPEVVSNGAGFGVSHSTGFGVPDAGEVVRLARIWVPRPEPEEHAVSFGSNRIIPDAGLRIEIRGTDIPSDLWFLNARASLGPFADGGTEHLPLVSVGDAAAPLTVPLDDRVALIRRGTNTFEEKIRHAAAAGAGLALIYNNRDEADLVVMGETELTPIPSLFLGREDGEALVDLLFRRSDVTAAVYTDAAEVEFDFEESLVCEHVGVRLDTSHTYRGDLRIVLTSPTGTRSVLQNFNEDPSAGPRDWTYWSARHFYEPSAGTWTLSVLDQEMLDRGNIRSVELIVRGIPVPDIDTDGLDDDWERRTLGSLAHDALADPDGDGYSNAREQAMGTLPGRSERPLRIDISLWSPRIVRLSWPGRPGRVYEVLEGPTVEGPWEVMDRVEGTFPECEYILPVIRLSRAFHTLRESSGGIGLAAP